MGLGPTSAVAQERRHAPIVYTRRSIFVHRIEAMRLSAGPSSALDGDHANHARGPGFGAYGESSFAQRCRYPLRIQPQLSVRAHSQLPGIAVSFMNQVVDIDMIGG